MSWCQKKREIRDSFFHLTLNIISATYIDAWKLSLHYILFLKLQQKYNTEQSVSINVFARILTKKILTKVEYYAKAALEGTKMQNQIIVQEEAGKEDISGISNTSVKKLRVCFYPAVTNEKDKLCKKSRRCVLCQNLSVACCSCCNKAYCYSFSRQKHDQTCLLDCIKFMKRRLS